MNSFKSQSFYDMYNTNKAIKMTTNCLLIETIYLFIYFNF